MFEAVVDKFEKDMACRMQHKKEWFTPFCLSKFSVLL